MIRIDVTLPVNDPERPGQRYLDRAQVWAGLLHKAENAVPFVLGMESCTVLERGDGRLLREVVFKGRPLREEVTFRPRERVSFTRSDEEAAWVIHNIIGEDADGALTLTFVSEMTRGPLVDAVERNGDDGGETAVAEMRANMLRVVANTLEVIRRISSTAGGERAPMP